MTDWIEHKPGSCPIPDAKAGEWECKAGYDSPGWRPVRDAKEYPKGWGKGIITHYRLIKPAVDWQAIADELASALGRSDVNMRRLMDRAPVRDLAETYSETESTLAKYQKAKGIS